MGNNVWGAGFHKGIEQGRIEGIAIGLGAGALAVGTKWFMDKRNRKKLEDLEAQRIEEAIKRHKEQKENPGSDDSKDQ